MLLKELPVTRPVDGCSLRQQGSDREEVGGQSRELETAGWKG